MVKRRVFSEYLSVDIEEVVIVGCTLYISHLGQVCDEMTNNSLPSVALLMGPDEFTRPCREKPAKVRSTRKGHIATIENREFDIGIST